MTTGEIGRLVRQIPTQYPFVLVDRILEHDAGGRLVAAKNVTGSEDFFAGHFPGQPVMPGVLILESLAQAAGIWLLKTAPDPRALEIRVVGFDDAKFRRPVVPGDQLRLEVQLEQRRGELARFRGDVRVGDARAAEARLLLQVATLAGAGDRPARARVVARAARAGREGGSLLHRGPGGEPRPRQRARLARRDRRPHRDRRATTASSRSARSVSRRRTSSTATRTRVSRSATATYSARAPPSTAGPRAAAA